MAWMRTHTGRKFSPLDPRLEDINILDIARGLATEARFAGQTDGVPYSVAQHSVYVARLCLEYGDDNDGRAGLLHDASEAYMGDLIAPIKHDPRMECFRSAEKVLQNAIYERFGLEPKKTDIVALSDLAILHTEMKCLTPWEDYQEDVVIQGLEIVPWSFYRAEKEFIDMFVSLFPEMSECCGT